MDIFATTTTTFSWLQIIVPAGLGLLTGLGGTLIMLGTYREKIKQLEKCNIQQRLSTLEGQFTAYQSQMSAIAVNNPNTYMNANSPLTLNDTGHEMLAESGAEKLIDDSFDSLYAEVEKRAKANPDYSAYDVQVAASEVVREMANKADIKPLKDYAFSKGVLLEIVLQVASIHLRDKSLKTLGFDLEKYYESDGDGHEHKHPVTDKN